MALYANTEYYEIRNKMMQVANTGTWKKKSLIFFSILLH